jgi:hypothetical protein
MTQHCIKKQQAFGLIMHDTCNNNVCESTMMTVAARVYVT